MDHRLTALAATQGGVVLRHQALERGVSAEEIKDLKRAKAWTPIRRGAYVERRVWSEADPASRHLLLCHAVRARLGRSVVFSHTSAAVIQGLDVWGADLDVVHVLRTSTSSPRQEGGVAHHRWPAAGVEPVPCDGFLVTPPAWTVITTAEAYGFEAGLCTADSALRTVLDHEVLRETFWPLRARPGARAAGHVVSFADGRAESVGESRSRIVLAALGFPAPELQAVLLDDRGDAGRTDFWFERYRTVGEFDGLGKYRVGPDGDPEEAARIVTREKLREDRLRQAGAEVVRWVWFEIERPQVLAARFGPAFERGRRLVVPVRWRATRPPRHARRDIA